MVAYARPAFRSPARTCLSALLCALVVPLATCDPVAIVGDVYFVKALPATTAPFFQVCRNAEMKKGVFVLRPLSVCAAVPRCTAPCRPVAA